MPTTRNKAAGLFILLTVVMLARFTSLAAHGIGTPRLQNVDAGPYTLSVWTDPNPLRTEATHVVVAVVDPVTRSPVVTDVEVTVRMRSRAFPFREVVQVAPTDQTNRLFYAAEFNGKLSPGEWDVGVAAAGPAGVTEEVTFTVDVTGTRRPNYMAIALGAVAVIVVIWLFAGSRTSSDAPRRARPR